MTKALNFVFGHDPATRKSTVAISNDPLPDEIAMGMDVWQSACSANAPWCWVSQNGSIDSDPEPVDEDRDLLDMLDDEDPWFVHFDTANVRAAYKVTAATMGDDPCVAAELSGWTTK